jgi:hypothetical protein
MPSVRRFVIIPLERARKNKAIFVPNSNHGDSTRISLTTEREKKEVLVPLEIFSNPTTSKAELP